MAALSLDERVRLIRDGGVQIAALVASSLIGLVMVPLLLAELGATQYGLWMTASALAGVLAVVDLGLGMTITREVAGGDADARFVASAGGVYVLLGIACGAVVGVTGLAIPGGRAVFAFTGVALAADLANMYSVSVLNGLRRFGTVGTLTVATVALRALGLLVLLERHAGLSVMVAWQASCAVVGLLAGLGVVGRLRPDLRIGLRLDLAALRARSQFALGHQLANAAGVIAWRAPQLLVGWICGSALVAPFTVAQKFPVIFELVLWKASDVLVPAVSARSQTRAIVADMLALGTRVTLFLALPGFVALWLLAPVLLDAWVGDTSADSVLVFRLVTAAVLAEGISHAAEQVLWGLGVAGNLLAIAAMRAGFVIALCVALVPPFGIVGGAIAMLAGIAIGSVAYLQLAARHCGVRPLALVIDAVRGLPDVTSLVFTRRRA